MYSYLPASKPPLHFQVRHNEKKEQSNVEIEILWIKMGSKKGANAKVVDGNDISVEVDKLDWC